MDLIAEEDRALPLILQPLLGFLDDFANAADALRHRRERLKVPVGVVGDDFGERRLAGARRPPEDAGPEVAAADQVPERFPGSQQMLLPEKLIKRLGAHPRGEGLGRTLEEGGLGHGTTGTGEWGMGRTELTARRTLCIVMPSIHPHILSS